MLRPMPAVLPVTMATWSFIFGDIPEVEKRG
jgi:hypothetical protein